MRCAVCDHNGRHSDRVLICRECAHPDAVRTYCVRCRGRMDLRLETAAELFAQAGLTIDRAGVVLRFDESGCPMCAPEAHGAPDIFTVDLDGFPPCQVA